MRATYSADDLALAALLKIVPGGYRVIDVNDERLSVSGTGFSGLR
ncbi:MAG TPA: hypothetical protein VGR61_09685 [Candidatus Dormibacteraeota bacterium]|nr:hypothetical protein [Candidatus Dormibacteraeota bacterium]